MMVPSLPLLSSFSSLRFLSLLFLEPDNFARVGKGRIYKINNVLSFLLSITVTWLNSDLICYKRS